VSLSIGGCVLVLLLAAWGATGHRIINSNVIVHLPSSMQFFIRNVSFLSQHASDADNRKGADGSKPYILKESPRHFINLESYPDFATKSIPEDFSTVIARYDSAAVFNIGIVPWASVWTLDSLTAQLRRGDSADALQSAADLGHYVGDAHQPLHCTRDYDGRSSIPGSSGIHSRYETTMINAHQSEIIILPDSVQFISNPIDFMFATVYESNTYVDSLYSADVYARQVTGWSGSGSIPTSYIDTLWARTKSFTELQFQRATIRYADLLYTAWVNSRDTTATGVEALFSVAPSSIAFGNVLSGSTKNDSVVVTNSGVATLMIDSLESDNPAFAVTPTSGAVAPSATLTFYINFGPTSTGAESGNLVFYHNGPALNDTVKLSGIALPTVGMNDVASGIPKDYELDKNYPNPFNPSTTIQYGLPRQSWVTVKVYSILGQEVRTLVDGIQNASYHRVQWNGKDNSGMQVSSGIYIFRMYALPLDGKTRSFTQAEKMLLMK